MCGIIIGYEMLLYLFGSLNFLFLVNCLISAMLLFLFSYAEGSNRFKKTKIFIEKNESLQLWVTRKVPHPLNLKIQPQIPRLLVSCIGEVEKRGMNQEDLYTTPEIPANVRKLEKKFAGSRDPNLSGKLIPTITATVKKFLCSIEGRLIPVVGVYGHFHQATIIRNKEDADTALRQAVSKLPQYNRNILAFLILHLQKVAERADNNHMDVKNLATAFGPLLVSKTEDSEPEDQIAVSAFGPFTLIFFFPSAFMQTTELTISNTNILLIKNEIQFYTVKL